MPVGISCHLGLSKIDPAHYAGNSGSLQGPKHDVRSMNDIAEFNNFHILSNLNYDDKTTLFNNNFY